MIPMNDKDALYILIECAAPITGPEDERWMNIELVCGGSEFTVNRAGVGVLSGAGQNRQCDHLLQGNKFWVRIPLEWLGGRSEGCRIRMTDNVFVEELLSVYRHGDSAPLGNLYYSYKFA